MLPSKFEYQVPEEVQKMVMERSAENYANPDDVQDLDELLDNLERDL